VYAQDLQSLAAVGLAEPARVALATAEIRFNRAPVATADAEIVRRSLDYLHTQFVPQDPWKAEVWLPPREGVQVRAADTDATHAHQGFARLRHGRAGFLPHESARLFQHDLKHLF